MNHDALTHSGKHTVTCHAVIRAARLTDRTNRSSSAITLRTWKIVLANTVHPDPLALYMIDAWMGFIPNLLFAEWLIRRTRIKARGRSFAFPIEKP